MGILWNTDYWILKNQYFSALYGWTTVNWETTSSKMIEVDQVINAPGI